MAVLIGRGLVLPFDCPFFPSHFLFFYFVQFSGRRALNMVGVDDGEGTPVPIPNTEVKLICVEDTWLATARENRWMPIF